MYSLASRYYISNRHFESSPFSGCPGFSSTGDLEIGRCTDKKGKKCLKPFRAKYANCTIIEGNIDIGMLFEIHKIIYYIVLGKHTAKRTLEYTLSNNILYCTGEKYRKNRF